jgi:hypothetical protein
MLKEILQDGLARLNAERLPFCLPDQLLIGIWFFAAPPAIDATRVKENRFLLAFI